MNNAGVGGYAHENEPLINSFLLVHQAFAAAMAWKGVSATFFPSAVTHRTGCGAEL